MKTTVDWIFYLVVRLFLLGLGFIPRHLAYLGCEALATLIYLVDARHRRIGMVNLGIAFPEKDRRWRRRVLLRSFQQLGDQAVELSRFPRLTAETIASRAAYEAGRGLENYLEARQKGKGVLFLTAHVSAWELLPTAHALHGYPLSFVVRPLDNPRLDRWATRLRSRFGNQVLTKRAPVRRILSLLRAGRDVGLLIDQNIQEKEGVFVPLFGRLACTSSGLAALALKTSAPVIPGFIYPQDPRGYYKIRFYPAVEVVPGADHGSDLVKYTAEFNRYIEEMIREFPHCWLWGHRRFQTQPDGTSPYRDSRGE